MCLPNFMKFHHCFFKILKNQNVADKQMDKRMDTQRENSIPPPQTQFAGGIIILHVDARHMLLL